MNLEGWGEVFIERGWRKAVKTKEIVYEKLQKNRQAWNIYGMRRGQIWWTRWFMKGSGSER